MSRTTILARIKEALSTPTDPHVRHGASKALPADEYRAFLPPVGDAPADRMTLFAEQAKALRVDFHAVADAAAAHAVLASMAQAEGWRSVATHASPATEAACAALGLPTLRTERGYDRDALERCDVGITGCEALIAQTGSVLVTSRSSGGRALTCLPPHHVVLATAEQLIADLPTAYALLRQRYQPEWPTFMGLITGPSRTGDIERILVLGAHGPKRLTVILTAW
jgi:L-lactate dehydrogenase complex protein LldG